MAEIDRTGASGEVRPSTPQSMITVAEAAERLGLSLDVVRDLLRSGRFCPVYRVTQKRVLVDPVDLDNWLRSKRVEPGATPAAEDVA